MTHLRVDSLVMGVLISYLFTFYFNFINNLFLKNKYSLLFFALLGLVWTPFLDPGFSYFVKTIGFTFLYISFGIILLYILLTKNINELLNKYLSKIVVDCISKIGFCSYSIYIIHGLVIAIIPILIKSTLEITILNNKYLIFLIKFISSVLIGVFITYRIEKYFLLARDKYFPSRAEVS
jgi:peptidoglycan/LPS O-acetylase OafA/YrhL